MDGRPAPAGLETEVAAGEGPGRCDGTAARPKGLGDPAIARMGERVAPGRGIEAAAGIEPRAEVDRSAQGVARVGARDEAGQRLHATRGEARPPSSRRERSARPEAGRARSRGARCPRRRMRPRGQARPRRPATGRTRDPPTPLRGIARPGTEPCSAHAPVGIWSRRITSPLCQPYRTTWTVTVASPGCGG